MRCQAVFFYCCLSCIARACLTWTWARESMDTDRCPHIHTLHHIAKLYIYYFLYFLLKERKHHGMVVMLLQANKYKVHQRPQLPRYSIHPIFRYDSQNCHALNCQIVAMCPDRLATRIEFFSGCNRHLCRRAQLLQYLGEEFWFPSLTKKNWQLDLHHCFRLFLHTYRIIVPMLSVARISSQSTWRSHWRKWPTNSCAAVT